MTHSDLIESLGGSRAVADRLGEQISTVSNWKQRGIPWSWRPAIKALARRRNVKLPEGFIKGTP